MSERHCESPARRQLLRATFASTFSAALPFSAEAIEPLTVLQAAAAVVGIVSGIKGMASDAGLRQSIYTVLNQLDRVIANQQFILESFRDLKLYIDEVSFRSWRDAYARSITTYNEQLDIYCADFEGAKWVLDRRLREDFEDLSKDCVYTTLTIGQMDVWAYPSFATGVSVVLLADRVLKTPSSRVAETKLKFKRCIDRWLEDQGATSLAQAIAKTEAEVAIRTRILADRSRNIVLKDRRVDLPTDGERHCTIRLVETVVVEGSLEKGFTGTVVKSESDLRCRRYREPREPIGRRGITSRTTVDPEVFGFETHIAKRTSGASSVLALDEMPIPVVPGFAPSGYAVVDQFNRERVDIYELMATAARQKQLRLEMLRMQEALA